MPRRLTALNSGAASTPNSGADSAPNSGADSAPNSGAASTPNSGADSSAATLHYVPWSMREEHALHAKSGGSDALARDGQPASCIVCFETEETKPGVDWHGCRTCSACWCDPCMAAMFDTARDHEDDVELTCPQCRGSIADMQEQSRLARIKGSLECSEETARDIVEYENLLTEVVHLCECEETGLPYFTIPAETVSWIMSRDPICTVVQNKQGHAEGTRLRRMLRASDYPGAFSLALHGLARVLRGAAPSALPFLEEIATNLSGMAAEDSPRARRVAAMAADARRVLNAERAAALAERGSVAAARSGARRAKPRTGEPPAPSGGIRKRPARRDLLP